MSLNSQDSDLPEFSSRHHLTGDVLMVDVLSGGKSMIWISPPPNFLEKVEKIGFKLKVLISVCVLL